MSEIAYPYGYDVAAQKQERRLAMTKVLDKRNGKVFLS